MWKWKEGHPTVRQSVRPEDGQTIMQQQQQLARSMQKVRGDDDDLTYFLYLADRQTDRYGNAKYFNLGVWPSNCFPYDGQALATRQILAEDIKVSEMVLKMREKKGEGGGRGRGGGGGGGWLLEEEEPEIWGSST